MFPVEVLPGYNTIVIPTGAPGARSGGACGLGRIRRKRQGEPKAAFFFELT